MKEQFKRTAALIGETGLDTLKNSSVAVFGIGGVGSYSAEALVRAGVGKIFLYDSDTVAESNINRQLIALRSTIGEDKVSVAANRYKDINPDCEITAAKEFITPESDIPFNEFDFIIDAVDNVTAKLFLITESEKRNIPIISVMGTGNKLDPTRLTVTDIYKTSACPLARVMRYELKKRGIKKLKVIFSDEIPIKPNTENNEKGKILPASMSMVPGSAGLIAAAEAVKYLINQ